MSIRNLINDITTPYGGYPGSALITFGWAVVTGAVILAFVFQAHSLNQARPGAGKRVEQA